MMLMRFLASVFMSLHPTDWPCRVCSGSGILSLAMFSIAPDLLYGADGRLELSRIATLIAIIAGTGTLTGWIVLAAFKERARQIRMSDKKQFGGDVVECLREVLPTFKALLDEAYKERIDDTKLFRQRVESNVEINAKRLNEMEPVIGRAAAALEFVPELRGTMANLDKTLQANTEVMEKMRDEQQKGNLVVAALRERVRLIHEAQSAHYSGEKNRRQRHGRRIEDGLLDDLEGAVDDES